MTTVKESISLGASADEVWAAVGDFGGIDAWHPGVATCAIQQDGEVRVRHLTLGDGSKIVERLDAHDDAARSYTYTILDPGPLPVSNYRSTLQVSGSGATATVSWSSEFDAAGVPEAAAQGAVSGVYTGGFGALSEKFGAA